MRPGYHDSNGHKHQKIDGRIGWKAKKRLIAMAIWIVGASLAGPGLYLLFVGSGTVTKVIGGVLFLAGALLLGFSKDFRDWIFMKW